MRTMFKYICSFLLLALTGCASIIGRDMEDAILDARWGVGNKRTIEDYEISISKLSQNIRNDTVFIKVLVQNNKLLLHQIKQRHSWSIESKEYIDAHPVQGATIQINKENLLTGSNYVSTDNDGIAIVTLKVYRPYVVGNNKPSYYIKTNALDNYAIQTLWAKYKISFKSSQYADSLAIYNLGQMADKYIEERINDETAMVAKNIKEINIDILNIDSHYPINGVLLTVSGNPPGPKELLRSKINAIKKKYSKILAVGDYFNKVDMLEYATNKLPKYFTGKDDIYPRLYYVPYAYTLSIRHPEYYYYSNKIMFTPDKTNISIYLSEMGRKMRVKVIKE